MYKPPARRITLALLTVLVLTLVGIWWPEVRHYWVPTPRYTSEVVLAAKANPNDATLARLASIVFERDTRSVSSRAGIIEEAERILGGQWHPPGFEPQVLHLPFAKEDMQAGWPTQQLIFATLHHVNVLLAAYEYTSDDRFLSAARDIINAFAEYESSAILPSGYLWNDHAVAQRSLVLVRYWNLIRNSTLFDEHSAELLLRFVGRTGHILTRPDQYTVRTNHGIMENLALLHLAASFPTLPESEMFKKVAVERLRAQLSFYQSSEGIILEHSIGYHALGIGLLATLTNYADILDADFNADVQNRLVKACQFLGNLLRPDGTVPLIGNSFATDHTPICADHPVPPNPAPTDADNVLTAYLESGYAINWFGRNLPLDKNAATSQTVVAWGNFATRAHKHDDEMSIFTWNGGLSILTGTGYWPYGDRQQKVANSWRGANAPFLSKEAPNAKRVTELLAMGTSRNITFLELSRSENGDKATIRRQIMSLGPREWLIVDFSATQVPDSLSSVWTLFPGWNVVREGGDASFHASHLGANRDLMISFASNDRMELEVLSRSDAPFGGWVALDSRPAAITPAHSIDARVAAGKPLVSFWSIGAEPSKRAVLQHWSGPADWSVCLDGEQCLRKLTRREDALSFQDGAVAEDVKLSAVASQRAMHATIDDRFIAAEKKYPYWRDFYPWRITASIALIGFFVFQEVGFALMRRWLGVRSVTVERGLLAAHGLALLCWLTAGIWLVFSYFGF
jgi:hypothetical protein